MRLVIRAWIDEANGIVDEQPVSVQLAIRHQYVVNNGVTLSTLGGRNL